MSQFSKSLYFNRPWRAMAFLVPLDRYRPLVFRTGVIDFQYLHVTMATPFEATLSNCFCGLIQGGQIIELEDELCPIRRVCDAVRWTLVWWKLASRTSWPTTNQCSRSRVMTLKWPWEWVQNAVLMVGFIEQTHTYKRSYFIITFEQTDDHQVSLVRVKAGVWQYMQLVSSCS